MKTELIFSTGPGPAFDTFCQGRNYASVHTLTDSNTATLALPVLAASSTLLAEACNWTMPAGEENKKLATLSNLWTELESAGATRRSLLVNIGGGVVTDLGGFAAATFKRGMDYVNIPTTVLGAVDASFGGKTGIDFGGHKNQIGTFAAPAATIISDTFFATLPPEQILSGYAEMLKHALLSSSEATHKALYFDPVADLASGNMLPLLRSSCNVKAGIVAADPHEKGLRKSLNLGHTAGHAFESLAMRRGKPIPHGYAVAYGMVVALILSHMKLGVGTGLLYPLAAYVRSHYGSPGIKCSDYPELLGFMHSDKKNTAKKTVNFTLLKNAGEPVIDCATSDNDIRTALDILTDLI